MSELAADRDSVSQVSDGYHTFDELYEHRNLLFVALMRSYPALAWRARSHEDGAGFEGWFIAGMHLPTGDSSYHLPESLWLMLDGRGITTTDTAPAWDGHTAKDVIERLRAWNVPKAGDGT